MKRLAGLALLLLTGCGYNMGEPAISGAKTLSIPMAVNRTLRRGNEFGYGGHEIDLTQAIRDMVVSRTSYDLVPDGDGDISAKVEIVAYRTPFQVEDRADRSIVSNVTIDIRLVIQRRDGTIVFQGDRQEVGYIVPARDLDEATARAEAFEKLSRWVVARLGGDW